MAGLVIPAELPNSIRSTIGCIAISALLEAAITLMKFFGFLPTRSAISTLIIGAIATGLLALLAFKIANHRMWAGRVFAFIASAGVVVLANMILSGTFLAEPPLVRAVTLVQTFLQIVALLALFTRGSRKWFRSVPDTGEAG